MNITLLEGQTYDVGDLKQKATSDDFYYGHLGRYAFSSSTIKYLFMFHLMSCHILNSRI